MALLPRIQRPRLALLFVLAGAFSFWLPDLAVHLFARCKFDSPHVQVITFLLPATFLCAYLIVRKFAVNQGAKWAGAAMVLGVWLTGGFFMTLGGTACGGGFAGPDGVRGGLILIALSFIPPVTFMYATYDGSLFALIAVTVGAILLWCIETNSVPLSFHRPPR